MIRVLGIDLGTRRIGVALSDALGLTAQPLATLPRFGGKRDMDAIAQLVRKHEVQRIVVGLPLNPDPAPGVSEEGRAARGARAFAERLRQALELPVELVDESFTTVEASQVLIAADLSRAKRRDVIDRVAAALILQRWLDANR